jgi:hypothetical protein
MIRERLMTHPCGKKDLMDLFTDYRRCSRRMDKLCKRGKCRRAGTAQLKEDGGRPEIVYVIGMVKADQLDHELRITRIARAASWPEMFRLYDVPKLRAIDKDGKPYETRPDAFFPQKGRWFEMDCETEKFFEIERKVKAYAQHGTVTVLWVTLSEARKRKLMAWTKSVELSFFAVYQDLLDDPTGEVWCDHLCNKVAIQL